MCGGETREPKNEREAAMLLARLVRQYCEVTPSEDGLIKMLQSRWATVTRLAHVIHDATHKSSRPVI